MVHDRFPGAVESIKAARPNEPVDIDFYPTQHWCQEIPNHVKHYQKKTYDSLIKSAKIEEKSRTYIKCARVII